MPDYEVEPVIALNGNDPSDGQAPSSEEVDGLNGAAPTHQPDTQDPYIETRASAKQGGIEERFPERWAVDAEQHCEGQEEHKAHPCDSENRSVRPHQDDPPGVWVGRLSHQWIMPPAALKCLSATRT